MDFGDLFESSYGDIDYFGGWGLHSCQYFKFKVNLRNGRYPADSFLLFALISIKHFSRIAIIYIKHLLILKHMVHGIFHFTGQNYHNLK